VFDYLVLDLPNKRKDTKDFAINNHFAKNINVSLSVLYNR